MISAYYSGGASNADAALSTGGAESSVAVPLQQAALLSAIAGVSLVSCAGLAVDDGLSSLSAAIVVEKLASGAASITFSAYGYPAGQTTGARGNTGYAAPGSPTTLDLYCGGAYLRASVNPALIPSGTSSSGISASPAPSEALFPAISSYPASDVYRCVYLRSDAGTAVTVTARVIAQAAGSSVSIAAAAAAGSPTPASPAGLSFGSSAELAIPAGGSRALWLLRSVDLQELSASIVDGAVLEFEVSA